MNVGRWVSLWVSAYFRGLCHVKLQECELPQSPKICRIESPTIINLAILCDLILGWWVHVTLSKVVGDLQRSGIRKVTAWITSTKSTFCRCLRQKAQEKKDEEFLGTRLWWFVGAMRGSLVRNLLPAYADLKRASLDASQRYTGAVLLFYATGGS